MRRVQTVLTLVLPFALASCIHIYEPKPSTGPAAGPGPAAPGGPAASPASKDPFKPWDDVLKDTKPIAGYLKAHQKRDNTLYLELRPDQLEQDFGMVLHLSRGVMGMMEQGAPQDWEARVMRWRRVGDQIQLVHRNPHYTANAGSPIRNAVDDNVGHAVVAAFKIESEHKESKAVLVDATSFFVSDYPDLASTLKWYYGNKPVMFEKDKSFVGKVAGFPTNTEIDADLSFRGSDYPIFGAEGLADYRIVPLRVRYSMFELPRTAMTPRLADDRVGHFLDAVWDYSKDRDESFVRRYVRRWRLEKKDPNAAVSDVVQPIVYYIDRTVPREYRRYVKEGVEAWQKAFERAGYKNAIVAREAPENDPNWSAEDARYSTVRWTPDPYAWAYGPSQTDPRSGEILNADVIVAAGFTTYYQQLHEEQISADMLMQFSGFGTVPQLAGMAQRPISRYACFNQVGKRAQMALQHTAMVAMGLIDANDPMPEQFLGDALRDLIMHEIGHTLGLRHNFRGSSGIPYDKLNDKMFTKENGLTLSVMDYAAVNINKDPKQQGYYHNPEVGTYDVWAIKYAYAPVERAPVKASGAGEIIAAAEAELPALQRIASEVARPLHTYGTDEDNWLGGYAVDPLTNAWELGSDPVRYGRDRIELIESIEPKLEKRLVADGKGYQRLRESVTNLLFERYTALSPITKTVGGLYVARDHKGDPNERRPFVPVPAAEQREAVKLIVDKAFAPRAFDYDATLLNKLAPNRWSDWSTPWTPQVDFPLHGMVNSIQTALLRSLLDNARLHRMVENTARVNRGSDAYTIAELFSTLTGSIWSEVSGSPQNVNSIRRNLQRSHITEMMRVLMNERTPFMMTLAPEDARSLARYELTQLSERLGRALSAGSAIDATTRAHLLETKVRIDRALNASVVTTGR
ncbi:MAG TPA: zinc-dependent metalloprotease [Longimicrobiales bacterium]